MAKVHIHIHTRDAETGVWLDKDIEALTSSIQALGMASPYLKSKLKPAMQAELDKLQKEKKSHVYAKDGSTMGASVDYTKYMDIVNNRSSTPEEKAGAKRKADAALRVWGMEADRGDQLVYRGRTVATKDVRYPLDRALPELKKVK